MGAFKVVWVRGSDGVVWAGVGLEKGEREMCMVVEEFKKEDEFGI